MRINLVWRNAIRRSSRYRPSRSCQSDYWPQVDPEQAIMSLCHPCRPLSEATLRLWLRSNRWNLSVYELSFQWDSREAVISCLLATIEMESWLVRHPLRWINFWWMSFVKWIRANTSSINSKLFFFEYFLLLSFS